MKTALTTLGISLFVLAGCVGQKQSANDFIQENIDNAVAQETLQTDIIEKSGEILNPRTIDEEGNIHYIPIDDWCSGFFPGNIWYTYELTGDKKWLPLAEKYTEALDSVQYLTWHHDVGFMIGSSYLNGYRFANKEEYKPVIIQTARGLDVGAIEYIHKQLVAQRDKGKAVLLVSLELDEVMDVSDRILVMYEGEIVGELDPKKVTVEELGLYMAGAKRDEVAKKA